MTSREFFGHKGYQDVHVDMFNKEGERIYESHTTSFKNAKPLIKKEIDYAVEDYRKNFAYQGEPKRIEIYTTPKCNFLTYDFETKQITFE